MDTFLVDEKREKKGANLGLLAGVCVALLTIAGLIFLFSQMSPEDLEKEDLLAGAFREGSKEFDKYTKDVIVTTNTDRLMQSMTGLGTITMHVGGSVYNKGDKVLSALQVRVGVIDPENKVIKARNFMLIPNSEHEVLRPGKTINVNVNIGGFKQDDDRANVQWKVVALKFRE